MEILYWCLLIIGGFLFGSIMFCEIIPKKLSQKDIYKISVDNNPGAFNTFKHCGIKIGIPCLVLDVLKGFIPVLIASLFMDANSIAFSFVMVVPVLGHAIGLFNRFHGGKGIATSFGVMLGLIPVTWVGIVVLAVLYIVFSTVIKINPASKRSVVVYALFAVICSVVTALQGLTFTAVGCALVSLVPIVRFLFSKKGMVENSLHKANGELQQ